MIAALLIAALGPAFSMTIAPQPGVPVRITSANAYRQDLVNWECVTFVNASTKTISRVRIRFHYFDASKADVGSDVLERKGSFAPGVFIEGPTFGAAAGLKQIDNCARFRFPHEGIETDVVSVERVEFADGTTWTSETPRGGGVPKPTPMAVGTVTPWPTPTPYVAPIPTARPSRKV